MIRIEDGVEVEATAERAFAFVTRIEGYPAWLPGVLQAEPADTSSSAGDTPAPGAGFRMVSEGPGGMKVASTGRVEAIDPPRSIEISATSGFFAIRARCEVTPIEVTPPARARTRIAVRAAIEPRGLATLAAGRIEHELRAAVPDTLRRLRERLEGAEP